MKEQPKTEQFWIKDDELSEFGVASYARATELKERLRLQYPEPGHRVRCRRRRTCWDVLVKVRTERKVQA